MEFVTSVLSSLPSTSSSLPSNAAIFGDHLVDMIWSVDTELDEFLSEARLAATSSAEETNLSTRDMSLLTSKARKVQQNVENDKQRIPVLVKRLLVRDFTAIGSSPLHFTLGKPYYQRRTRSRKIGNCGSSKRGVDSR